SVETSAAVAFVALNSVALAQTELNAIQATVFVALNSVAVALSRTGLNAIQAAVFSAALSSVESVVSLLPGIGKQGVSDITKNLFVFQTDALRIVEGFNELVANWLRGHAVEERGIGLVPRRCDRLRNGLSCPSGQGLRPRILFRQGKCPTL
ncbi:hypothetical protein BD310DRAFT_789468, partial [Dichomitus squalens]